MVRQALLGLAFVAILGASGAAQSVRVEGPEPATVRLGGEARLVVVCDGTRNAQLLPPERVDGLTIRVGGASPLFQSINGRVSESVRWSVSVTPSRLGRLRIPPFRVRVGSIVKRTDASTVRCVEDKEGKAMTFLEAGVLPGNAFVQQPVDVWIRVGVDAASLTPIPGTRVQRPYAIHITAPWFDELPAGVRTDVEQPRNRRGAAPVHVNGTQRVVRPLGKQTKGDREYVVFEMQQRFLANRAGDFRLDAPTVRFAFATRLSRSIFGDIQVADQRDLFGRGAAFSIGIRPLPETGRPSDFTNAVGDLRLTGQLSKRKVKVGENIKLVLRIEGDGNFEFLDVPKLDGLTGFHVFGKEVERKEDHILASYDLAALDDQTNELPKIPFSYFDPTAKPPTYKRGDLEPIPIEVVAIPGGAKGLEPLPEARKALTPGVDDIWDRMPIEGPAPRRSPPEPWLVWLAMLGPIALFGVACFVQRRRTWLRSNPAVLRSRQAAGAFEARLGTDGTLRAFSVFVAERLGWDEGEAVRSDLVDRLVAEGLPQELAARTDDFMQKLLQSRYAGGAGEEALAQTARELVREIDSEASR